MRVGMGYDIHRLEPGRRLVLGGVEIPHDRGLAGHSDADVALHALMDALLGAAGLGDIGVHFPPGDDRYRDASSLLLLGHVSRMVRNAGFRVANIDLVIVAEEPRVRPHVERMTSAVADALQLDRFAIGIKATTNEGLGPEGRKEGISAHAVVLLEAQT
jgi:2-C-methyl-D-erythritol 2,4-cyclodiphosphate synthase